MTVKECYESMNADFEGVMSRLMKEARVAKYTLIFPSDPSYSDMVDAYKVGDVKKAFLSAHSLKGTSANLGFTALYNAACEVTEEFRSGNPSPDTAAKMAKCEEEYNNVIAAISVYASNRTDM